MPGAVASRRRLLDVLICARGFMYKYLGVWKLGEAPNILTGLSYNGMDKEGNAVWDGVRNIDLAGLSGCAVWRPRSDSGVGGGLYGRPRFAEPLPSFGVQPPLVRLQPCFSAVACVSGCGRGAF